MPRPSSWSAFEAGSRSRAREAIAAAPLGMAERPDSTPDLATIDVPTLVITSTVDRLIAPDVTAGMADGSRVRSS